MRPAPATSASLRAGLDEPAQRAAALGTQRGPGRCRQRPCDVPGIARALLLGADEDLARAGERIEPRPHHAEVLVLIAHVMVVVPRQVIARPRRIEVRAAVV